MRACAIELGFTPAARPRLSNGNYDPALAPVRHLTTALMPIKNLEPTAQDLDELMAKRKAINKVCPNGTNCAASKFRVFGAVQGRGHLAHLTLIR